MYFAAWKWGVLVLVAATAAGCRNEAVDGPIDTGIVGVDAARGLDAAGSEADGAVGMDATTAADAAVGLDAGRPCTDLLTSPENCGACGHTCATGLICNLGACVAPACRWALASPSPVSLYLPDGTPAAIAVADFNEDGRQDLAVAAESGPLYAFLQQAGGGFGEAQQVQGSAYAAATFRAFDVNDDHHWDLAAGIASDPFWLGLGTGAFQRPDLPSLATPLRDAATADLNGDRKLDMVAQVQDRLQVLLSDSAGTWKVLSPSSPTALPQGTVVALWDLDADKKPDLLVTTRSAGTWTVSAYLGQGDGTFAASATGSFTHDFGSTFDVRLEGCHLKGAGSAEVVLANAEGKGFVLAGAALSQLQALQLGSNLASLRCADLNSDGKDDLVASRYSTTGGVSVLFYDSQLQALGAPVTLWSDENMKKLDVGDLNADHVLDVVVAGASKVQIFHGRCQ